MIQRVNEETTQTSTPRTGQYSQLIAGVAVVLCLVTSATALAFAGWEPAEIVALLSGVAVLAGPLLVAVGKLSDLKHETTEQTKTIDKIDHQTNGVLTARIKDAVVPEVRRAVTEALSEPIPYTATESDDDPDERAA